MDPLGSEGAEMCDLSVEKTFFLQTVSAVSIEAHPVLKAVWDGSVKLLRTLVDGGLPIDYSNEDGQTPLIVATMKKWPPGEQKFGVQLVEWLIQRGADVNRQDRFGKTALIYTVGLQQPTAMAKCLLDNNADIFVEDNIGFSALVYAYNSANPELTRLLNRHCKSHGREMVILETKIDSNFLSYLKIQKRLGTASNSVNVGGAEVASPLQRKSSSKAGQSGRGNTLPLGVSDKLVSLLRRKSSSAAVLESIGESNLGATSNEPISNDPPEASWSARSSVISPIAFGLGDSTEQSDQSDSTELPEPQLICANCSGKLLSSEPPTRTHREVQCQLLVGSPLSSQQSSVEEISAEPSGSHTDASRYQRSKVIFPGIRRYSLREMADERKKVSELKSQTETDANAILSAVQEENQNGSPEANQQRKSPFLRSKSCADPHAVKLGLLNKAVASMDHPSHKKSSNFAAEHFQI